MSNQSFMQRHHFLLRRLHSLTGVIPIGVFMILHLTTNASIVWGAVNTQKGSNALERGVNTFQHEVDFIHSMPGLILIEVFGLWLPIAFHSIFGIYYAKTGKMNTSNYAYQSNWRYSLQRFSGYIGVIFLFYHVATLRWGWDWLPFASTFNAQAAASTTAIALKGGAMELGLSAILVSLFYMIGVSMLVFHLANGLWTAAITWGITVSEGAQRRWGFACAGLGAGLMLLAWSAVIGFATLDVEKAQQAELKGGHGAPSAIVQEDEATR